MTAVDDLKALVSEYRERGEPDPPTEWVECPLCGRQAKCKRIPAPSGLVSVIGCECVSRDGLWVGQ